MVEIILKKNIRKLGKQNTLVKVKDGYANYLIAEGLAMLGTQANKNKLAELIRQQKQKEAKMLEKVKEVGKKLDSIQLIFEEKVDEGGKLFATITSLKIAEAYKTHNITLDAKQISILQAPIKEIGMHQAKVVLHETIEKTIHLDVRASK